MRRKDGGTFNIDNEVSKKKKKKKNYISSNQLVIRN